MNLGYCDFSFLYKTTNTTATQCCTCIHRVQTKILICMSGHLQLRSSGEDHGLFTTPLVWPALPYTLFDVHHTFHFRTIPAPCSMQRSTISILLYTMHTSHSCTPYIRWSHVSCTGHGYRVQPFLPNPTSTTIVRATPSWAMLVLLKYQTHNYMIDA